MQAMQALSSAKPAMAIQGAALARSMSWFHRRPRAIRDNAKITTSIAPTAITEAREAVSPWRPSADPRNVRR